MIRMVLKQTEDYDALTDLFIKNELEFSKEEPVATDLVKCWSVTAEEGSRKILAGGIALAMRQGEYIIDGIAVEPDYRKAKAGRILLDKAIEEVKKLGGKAIYLVARAPEFFRKQGFVTIKGELAPNFFECLTCEQYGKQCHPEVMKMDIE